MLEGCGTLAADQGRTKGARGTPAGAEKQQMLQRAVEPQFSPFEQLRRVKKLLTLLKPAGSGSVPVRREPVENTGEAVSSGMQAE
jgi:hypothetical protein